MATVIKEPTKASPGIAVITSNELLNGIVGRGKKALQKIQEFRDERRWIFGVHMNGSLHGKKPEIPSCISFVLCGDANADYIRHISQPVFEWSAEYFVPIFPELTNSKRKECDLLIVSRIAEAKRFDLSVDILNQLLKLNPRLRVNIVATYLSGLDSERAYVEKIAPRLRTFLDYEVSINAIDASLFGMFPITNRQIMTTVANSRGVLITSALEGGPRILGEAASLKVPVYVCEDLKSNLEKHFEALQIKRISTTPVIAAQQLNDYLNGSIETGGSEGGFNAYENRYKFKSQLEGVLREMGYGIDGIWYLDDLNIRLPGHSRAGNMQIMYDEGLFLDWCKWIDCQGGCVASQLLAKEKGRLVQSRMSMLGEKIVRGVQMAARRFSARMKKVCNYGAKTN